MAKRISSESKSVSKRIESLAAFAEQIKKDAVAAAPVNDREYIGSFRYPFNLKLMELCMGATYSETENKKGEVHKNFSFNAKVPNAEELCQISKIVAAFCTWEDQFIDSKSVSWNTMAPVMNTTSGESLEIDDEECSGGAAGTIVFPCYSINVDNTKKKNIMEQLVGTGNSISGAVTRYLDESNVLELVTIGEKVHKHKKKIMWICIGIGAAALLTGGVVTGVCIANHKKKEDEEENLEALPEGENFDDIIDDVDADDDIVQVDMDPIPVEMDFV